MQTKTKTLWQVLTIGLLIVNLLSPVAPSLAAVERGQSGPDAPSNESSIVLDGVRDADYVQIASDPAGDLSMPGPGDWSGVWWTDVTALYAAADAANLYVYVDLPAYTYTVSTGQFGLALDVDGQPVSGGNSDPWGNAISFEYNYVDGVLKPAPGMPDYVVRGNIYSMGDNGWTELRAWNGAGWDGGGTNWGGISGSFIGTHIAYGDNLGVEFVIPLADIGNPDPANVHLQYFGMQGGGGKGAYDTIPSDDQSNGWDDATLQQQLVSVPVAVDAGGDLAPSGPGSWNGVWWTDMTRMHVWADHNSLYLFLPSAAYSETLSVGQLGLAINTQAGGGMGDPWGNAITYAYTATWQNLGHTPVVTTTTLAPDYMLRGNIFGPADNGWVELRTWNGSDWNTGGGVDWGGIGNSGQPSVPGSKVAWTSGDGLRLRIPFADINVAPGDTIDLEFYGMEGGGGKGTYDTVPSDDQSTAWDDPTTQKFYASYTIPSIPQPTASIDGNVWWDGLLHNSWDGLYRVPFGALPLGEELLLRFRTFHNDVQGVRVRFWDTAASSEFFRDMYIAASDAPCYDPGLVDITCDYWEYAITPTALTTLYYRFIATDSPAVAYYADDGLKYGGVGEVTAVAADNSYAVTVYDPAFEPVSWMKDAIVYQIFPDRFRNGNLANDPSSDEPRYGYPPEPLDQILLKQWDEMPEGHCRYYQNPATPCNEQPRGRDYYGGDLQGLLEKMDYIEGLGVKVIYLNPIFEAGSNHLYDTQDYSLIDHFFGSNDDFVALTNEAHSRGMKVILDGVFNHVSSDGPYMDRYGHYETVGACESLTSPYRDWFTFREVGAGNGVCAGQDGPDSAAYEAWFGFDSLPVLNKYNQEVHDLIMETAVYWLDLGADGWRLDVMPDASFPPGFWQEFRQTVLAAKPDAIILGELWKKGDVLPYVHGDQADSTMNYRFRNAVMGFFGVVDNKGFPDDGQSDQPPSLFAEKMISVREDYPDGAYYTLMNLLGSHDTMRILWDLTPGANNREEKEFDPANVAWGLDMLRLAAIIQMTTPGAPTIYYGDEVAVTGDDDPDDRRTFPWVDPVPDPTVQFDAATYSAWENEGSKTITATLSAAAGVTATVDYAVTALVVNGDPNFTPITGTLTFAPGVITQTFSVLLIDDLVYAGDDSAFLELLDPVSATLEAPYTATLLVQNDDPMPTVQFSAAGFNAGEQDGSTAITVTLSGPSASAVTVDYALTPLVVMGNPNFVPASGTLTFAAGETEKTILVTLVDDAVYEGDDTAQLALSNPVGAALGTPVTAVLTVLENDPNPLPAVQFSAAAYSAGENDGTTAITVTLASASAGMVMVDYAVSPLVVNGSPNFTAASGTLIFLAGETETTFNVALVDDTVYEGDDTAQLALSNPVGAALGTPTTAVLTVLENEPNPLPAVQFSAAAYSAGEEDGTTAITVTLDSASAGVVTVNYAVTALAVNGSPNFTAASGTLTFLAGETESTFNVALVDDAVYEGDDTAQLALSSPVGAALGTPGTAVLTVLENDPNLLPAVQFNAAAYSAGENDGTAAIVVMLDSASAGVATVDYAVNPLSVNGSPNFTAASGTLTFLAGETQLTFNVALVDDAVYEGDDTAQLVLSNPVGADLGTPVAAVLTVQEDDPISYGLYLPSIFTQPAALSASFRPISSQPLPSIQQSPAQPDADYYGALGNHELLDHYRVLTALRNQNDVFRNGELTFLLTDDANRTMAYLMRTADNGAIIAVNRDEALTQTLTIDVSGYLPGDISMTDVLTGGVGTVAASNGLLTFELPALSAAVLLPDAGQNLTLPDAPLALLATAGNGEVQLSWTGASPNYAIYRSLVRGGGYQYLVSTASTVLTDTTVTNGKYYYYVVRGQDASGMLSEYSNEASAIPAFPIDSAWIQWPEAITHTLGVTPTQNIYGQVYVPGLTDGGGDPANIMAQLGYGPQDSDYTAWAVWKTMTFNTVAGSNFEYAANLRPEATGLYDYVVRFSTDLGNTWTYGLWNQTTPGYLNVLPNPDITPPAAPTNLRVTDWSAGFIALEWDAVADAAEYWLYRSEITGTYVYTDPLVQVTAPITAYTDLDVQTGTTYYYVVRAIDPALNPSPDSNEVSKTAEPKMVDVTFRVLVPAETPSNNTVYIAGGTLPLEWNPSKEPMTNLGGGIWEITLQFLEGTDLQYKYVRGAWERVEWWGTIINVANRSVIINYGVDGTQLVDNTATDWGNGADSDKAVQYWRDPLVSSTTPPDGYVGAAPTEVVVNFSRDIQPLEGGDFSGSVVVTLGANVISGTVSAPDTLSLVWTPDAALAPGVYTVTVDDVRSDLLTDNSPVVIQTPYVFTFTVE